MTLKPTATEKLRLRMADDALIVMPSCFDALSAKLIAQAGFEVTFMSGFAVSVARIGAPDLGLMSYGEVLDQARNITDAISIPLIADGDTGYGNAMNIRRTVSGFAKAGCAGVLIEDQLAPKRCGHTQGKDVVGREEAFDRIKAAVDARQAGSDIAIMARTDANHTHGLAEAIARAQKFHELGADILFVEAPKSVEEMRQIGLEVPGCKIVNIVEGGITPELPMAELSDIGYQMAVYPLTLMASAMQAMTRALEALMQDAPARQNMMDFAELRTRIGFDKYYENAKNYDTSARR
jgi:2-methylisocitrate lyase-like PEP mutase family enzyme